MSRWSSYYSTSDWPIPPSLSVDSDLDSKASWSHTTPSASRSNLTAKEKLFKFPVGSERLFAISRGDFASGTFRMTQDDQIEEGYVQIRVVVECYPPELFDLVKVCALKRKERQHGIGILTRNRPHNLNHIFFRASITVTLPRIASSIANSDGILMLKNFETDMPLFPHQLDNLASCVHFRSISLRSMNVPILVESIRVGKANVQTTNAPIEGLFAASSSINLITDNAQIRASVFLQNSDPRKFSDLKMKSLNGPIKASIILSAPSPGTTSSTQGLTLPESERGGNFAIDVSTQLAPLTLTFPSAPPSCNLHLQCSTSLAPADVSLPNTYEGAFEVKTTMASAVIGPSQNGRVGDPEGLGRHRKVEFSENGRRVLETEKKGWVSWGDDGKWRGEVKVETSLGFAALHI